MPLGRAGFARVSVCVADHEHLMDGFVS